MATSGGTAFDAPAYTGSPSVEVNGGQPDFDDTDLSRSAFEEYSPLDDLGRCGPAFAMLGSETMPDEPRGSIGMIRPSGWHTSRYDWVDGGYLYNRCHLIGYQLSGENDNELNLITGTRSMNVQGMEPYENEVAHYIQSTGNHVLYRVTPVFEDDNLVASGVLMEAQSAEDKGAGVQFCVWCYNVEPGVAIDYATGENTADDAAASESAPVAGSGAASASESAIEATAGSAATAASESATDTAAENATYILNTNTHRFHVPDCPSVDDMKEKNKRAFYGTREEAIEEGFKPCGVCNP